MRLERACAESPALARAWRTGALSWVKAEALVPLASADPLGRFVADWVRWAGRVTVRRLRDDVERALTVAQTDPEAFGRLGGLPSEARRRLTGDVVSAGVLAEREIRADHTLSERTSRSDGTADCPVDVPLGRAEVEREIRADQRTPEGTSREGQAFDRPGEVASERVGVEREIRTDHTPSEATSRRGGPGDRHLEVAAEGGEWRIPRSAAGVAARAHAGLGGKPRPGETCWVRLIAPAEVIRLVRAALSTVRRRIEAETGHLPTAGEALGAMLDHAFAAWGEDARVPARHRVLARDGWRCAAPGCTSMRNLHDHHVRFRSAGGSDALENRVTLCAFHHLRGVHAGRLRCVGRAPDGLAWQLGIRPGAPPLVAYRSGDVREVMPARRGLQAGP